MDKLILFIFLSLTIVSCTSAPDMLKKQENLLKKELEKIDWSKVDIYPSVGLCDSIESQSEKNHCFYDFIHKELQVRLDQDTLYGTFLDLDTIQILVRIKPDAHIEFNVYNMADSLKIQRQSIDSLLKLKQSGFPDVYPAFKQGIPVTTEFVMPIVLTRK
ncbi:hypothetical protein [Myroides sp. LJL119]